MPDSNEMAPDAAYAEAVRVLSVLPVSATREFANWVEQPSIEHTHLKQLVLDYDTNRNDTFTAVDHLPTTAQAGFRRLLDNCGSERWGEVDDNYLMMRLEIPHGGSTGKLLLLHHSVVLEALQALYPLARLTPAEHRVIMQVVAGETPKSAALTDNVSVETKRTQLKSILSKTGISSQKELSSALIAHLVLQIGSNQKQPTRDSEDPDRWLNDYINRYFPASVRYHVNRGNSGHSYRCIDCGDPNGEVLIYLHQLGAVHCSEAVIEQARANGIRLLIPLRNGAVAPRDPELNVAEHIEHAIDGIHYAMQLGDVKIATLMTGTSGCAYALKFIQQYPQHVERLIVTAASLRGERSKVSLDGYLRSAYRLAVNNRLLFKSMVAYMRKSFHDLDNLKRFFEHVYRGSASDQKILNEIFNDKNAAEAFQYRIIHSAPSLLHDIHHIARPDWTPLLQCALPIHFIHGDQDALNHIEDIDELSARLKQACVHRVKGAGTWLLGKNPSGTFDLITEIMGNSSTVSSTRSARSNK